ncbi:MAG: alpha/beta fold hydrolase [Chitinophagaceae bacterium]
MKQHLFLSILLLVIFTGCKKNENQPALPANSRFVSASLIRTFSKADMQALATKAGFGTFSLLAKNDADFYRMIYKTSFKGKDVEVSGLLGIPKNVTVPPSLVCAQHGTIFKFSDAPTNFPNIFSGFELFAAAGFVVMLPDYIGYGVSQHLTHPYYDQASSGLTVVDMIKATKDFLVLQKMQTSTRQFLVGYSEGGYATMAAQKEIETNSSHGISLTAAAEGAGGYDLTVFLSTISTTTTYAAPSFLSFILKSYDSTYGWNRPFTDFFTPAYAAKIPALLNGTKSREEIDAALTTSIPALLNPAFYAALTDPMKEIPLKTQLLTNSFISWVPKAPTRLYHGTADEVVPYETTIATFNRWKTAGATNVEFFSTAGGTHKTTVEPMMLNALGWLLELDK